MIRITTPATSANIAVGFDSMALALSIHNVFLFEPSTQPKVVGFPSDSPKHNLVYQAYQAFTDTYVSDLKIPAVTITLEHQGIPISRGLGSSASCIVAGVLAANALHNVHKSLEECARFAADVEGHPDNVYACMFGGLTAVFLDESTTTYPHHTFEVSNQLLFTILIPESTGNTATLRQELPEQISVSDAVFHLSRMIHVPRAFAAGDMELLSLVLQDRIHEDVRSSELPERDTVKKMKATLDGVLMISGAGPSLLVVSDLDITDQLEPLQDTYEINQVHLTTGTQVEVIR